MKKSGSRKERRELQELANYLAQGAVPVKDTDAVTFTRIKNHDALVEISQGRGSTTHLDTLDGAFSVADVLARLGVGAEHTQVIRHAQAALSRARSRTPPGFSGPELTVANMAMDRHDAQLDNSLTTVAVMEQVLDLLEEEAAKAKTQQEVTTAC